TLPRLSSTHSTATLLPPRLPYPTPNLPTPTAKPRTLPLAARICPRPAGSVISSTTHSHSLVPATRPMTSSAPVPAHRSTNPLLAALEAYSNSRKGSVSRPTQTTPYKLHRPPGGLWNNHITLHHNIRYGQARLIARALLLAIVSHSPPLSETFVGACAAAAQPSVFVAARHRRLIHEQPLYSTHTYSHVISSSLPPQHHYSNRQSLLTQAKRRQEMPVYNAHMAKRLSSLSSLGFAWLLFCSSALAGLVFMTTLCRMCDDDRTTVFCDRLRVPEMCCASWSSEPLQLLGGNESRGFWGRPRGPVSGSPTLSGGSKKTHLHDCNNQPSRSVTPRSLRLRSHLAANANGTLVPSAPVQQASSSWAPPVCTASVPTTHPTTSSAPVPTPRSTNPLPAALEAYSHSRKGSVSRPSQSQPPADSYRSAEREDERYASTCQQQTQQYADAAAARQARLLAEHEATLKRVDDRQPKAQAQVWFEEDQPLAQEAVRKQQDEERRRTEDKYRAEEKLRRAAQAQQYEEQRKLNARERERERGRSRTHNPGAPSLDGKKWYQGWFREKSRDVRGCKDDRGSDREQR
ncbi:hypothetical protein FRC07_010987, partial [Ceratobasidium sp. 392]